MLSCGTQLLARSPSRPTVFRMIPRIAKAEKTERSLWEQRGPSSAEKAIKINRFPMIWTKLIQTIGMRRLSRSLGSWETQTMELSRPRRRTGCPSWPALTTEPNLMEFNPAKIAISNLKRAIRAQDLTKLQNLKNESTFNLMFPNLLIWISTAKRPSAISEDLNMEKKMRMTTPIFHKFSRRPIRILILILMIFTITQMCSSPPRGSTSQERRWWRRTRCDPRLPMALGRESVP